MVQLSGFSDALRGTVVSFMGEDGGGHVVLAFALAEVTRPGSKAFAFASEATFLAFALEAASLAFELALAFSFLPSTTISMS